jgi:uncharacterized protein YkwD
MSISPKIAAVAAAALLATASPAAAVSSSTYEKDVIDRTNVKRVDNDRVKVKAHSCADRWAEGQARWMAKHGTLEHRSGRLQKIMADCNFSEASENIAYGYSSGSKVVSAWMTSPGHRANLLRKSSRYIGVGAVKDSDGVWWVAQVFGRK